MIVNLPPFDQCLRQSGCSDCLVANQKLHTLQLNITIRCNLLCKHCHILAGPQRSEEMSLPTMQAALEVFAALGMSIIDITGGAPELNPDYQQLISEASSHASKVMTRTNLVILTLPEYRHLPAFWAGLGIEVVGSLPHYEQRNTDRQRGDQVFERAIQGLLALNEQGYGRDPDKVLNLVSNPGGAFLPPSQASAEQEFKQRLGERYGISFNSLFTITNNPVGRFGRFLREKGVTKEYLNRLYQAFNPQAAAGIMCRDQISVSCDGKVFDCDFNQAAGLPQFSSVGNPLNIRDIAAAVKRDGAQAAADLLCGREIRSAFHCYACVAGSGSSCGGTTA